MTFSKVFAASMMTAFLASPLLLIGCAGKSWGEFCEDAGAACGDTPEKVAKCKSIETNSEAVGCSDQFTAYSDCLTDKYETPTAEQCAGESQENPCAAETEAFASCVLAACVADPSNSACK